MCQWPMKPRWIPHLHSSSIHVSMSASFRMPALLDWGVWVEGGLIVVHAGGSPWPDASFGCTAVAMLPE